MLDYSWINTLSDYPLDNTRLTLILQEAIETIDSSPTGTKVKSEYGIEPKKTALKHFKEDLVTAHKNLHYWFCTESGKQHLKEEPWLLEEYVHPQGSPKSPAPLEVNCLF